MKPYFPDKKKILKNKLSINEEEVEKIQSFGHWGKPLIWEKSVGIKSGFELGVSSYYAKEFPKSKTHEDEEAIYIISGDGVAKIGDKKFKLKKSTAIYIPSNTPHCIKNKGKKALKAVYCHSGKRSLLK
ncbi:hypothetical protein A3K72_01060 [Candidatus Woesearchaeota archaeon RBG_13_36_6]|nr:MAG: hypothetical protein A3K72_01060 [Candidatus Woesearchaeota archaeon RBG_13_36_6]